MSGTRRTRRTAAALCVVAAVVPLTAGTASAAPAHPVATAARAASPWRCGTVSGGSGTFAAITAVRLAHHPGYDRFVVTFRGSHLPRYTVVPKSSPTFWLDPSDRRVTLRGTAGLKIVLSPASGIGSYAGPTDLRPGLPELREARRIGDFEHVTTWGLGLARQACKRVTTLTGPTRLVVDVRT